MQIISSYPTTLRGFLQLHSAVKTVAHMGGYCYVSQCTPWPLAAVASNLQCHVPTGVHTVQIDCMGACAAQL